MARNTKNISKCIYTATERTVKNGTSDSQTIGHCDNIYSHNCNSKCPGTCKDKEVRSLS